MADEINTVDDVQQGVVGPAGESVSADEVRPDVPAEAAPARQSHEENQAFAQMRRQLEANQRKLEEAEAKLAASKDQESYLAEILRNEYGFDGDLLDMADELAAIQAGTSVEEIRGERLRQEAQRQAEEQAEQEREQFIRSMEKEKEYYKNLAVQKLKADLLSEIKNTYPECTAESVDEFGLEFAKLLQNGISPALAYAAAKSVAEAGNKPLPPEIGAVNNTAAPDREYFTRDEVANMTKEEVHRNWKKIQKSRGKW